MIEGEEPESRISPASATHRGQHSTSSSPEDEGKPYGCQAIKASNEDAKIKLWASTCQFTVYNPLG